MNLFELVAVLSLDKKEYDEGLKSAESEASSFGSKLKSGLSTAAKVGGASLAVLGTSTVAVTKSLLNTSAATAELGDHIDKQSQKIGISAKAYQEWDFILTHNGASVDSLQASMKNLSKQASENADEFAELGISEEYLKTASPEELFERVIKELQTMEEGTQRTTIASKLLGKAGTELAPVLNSTSDEIEEMRQQAHDLGKVMSDEAVKSGAAYEDSLYNLQTAIGGMKNKLGTELLPSIVNVMDGITGIFTGDESAMEKVVGGIEKIATKISEALPKIAKVASKIITNIGKALIQNLPKLTKAGTEIVTTLISVVTENLPMIFDMGLEILMALLDGMFDALPQIINGLVDLAVKIVEKLPSIIEKFVDAIPGIIDTLIDALTTNLPKIIEGLIGLISSIVDNIPKIIEGLIDAIPKIIDKLFGDGGFLSSDNIQKVVTGLISLVHKIVLKIPEIIGELLTEGIPNIIKSVLGAFGLDVTTPGGFGYELYEGIKSVLGEAYEVAKEIFGWFGRLMDDPAKALEEAFDGIKNYAQKTFESIKSIVENIWEVVSGLDERVDRANRSKEAREKIESEGWAIIPYGDGSTVTVKKDSKAYQDYMNRMYEETGNPIYASAGSAEWQNPMYQNKETNVKVDVSGEIDYKGVNNEGEVITAGKMTEEQLARMFQTQGRLYG